MPPLPRDVLTLIQDNLTLLPLLAFAQCSKYWYQQCTSESRLRRAWDDCPLWTLDPYFCRLLGNSHYCILIHRQIGFLLQRALELSDRSKKEVYLHFCRLALEAGCVVLLPLFLTQLTSGEVWSLSHKLPRKNRELIYEEILRQGDLWSLSTYNLQQALFSTGPIPKVRRDLCSLLESRGLDPELNLAIARNSDPIFLVGGMVCLVLSLLVLFPIGCQWMRGLETSNSLLLWGYGTITLVMLYLLRLGYCLSL